MIATDKILVLEKDYVLLNWVQCKETLKHKEDQLNL